MVYSIEEDFNLPRPLPPWERILFFFKSRALLRGGLVCRKVNRTSQKAPPLLVYLQTPSFLSFSFPISKVYNLVQFIWFKQLCPLVEKTVYVVKLWNGIKETKFATATGSDKVIKNDKIQMQKRLEPVYSIVKNGGKSTK